MRLPKIQEDECSLKTNYCQCILGKPVKKYKTDRIVFDWQSAEIDLISRIPDEENLLDKLIQYQNIIKAAEIANFYSFFFVNHLLAELYETASIQSPDKNSSSKKPSSQKQRIIKQLIDEIDQIKNKKSWWHQIVQLIELRQNLLSKINQQVSNNQLETVYSRLDDIRFINFQIIKKIESWCSYNQTDSDIKPFFLHEGRNYSIKMINDNANVINVLNSKAVKFLSPPNPFYLSRDGNKTSMAQTQQSEIDECMQLLAKQKAQQLKMLLNPPKFGTQIKNNNSQLKNLKQQLQMEKAERIRNIYKSNINIGVSLSNIKTMNNSKNKEDKNVKLSENQRNRNKNLKYNSLEPKHNTLQKLIQQKQVAVVQKMKTSQIKLSTKANKKYGATNGQLPNKQYTFQTESIKKRIQQNKSNKITSNAKLDIINGENQVNQNKTQNLMRLSTLSNKSQIPKTVAQIKMPKPKMRLIMEKQSTIEQQQPKNSAGLQNLQMYRSTYIRKTSSSFFKQIDKIQQKNPNLDIKPVTQYARSFSSNNLGERNFQKTIQKQKKTLLNLEIKRNLKEGLQQSKNKNKNKSKSNLQQKNDLSFSKGVVQKNDFKMEQKSEIDSKIDNSQSSIRAINSKLRDLTIMSIYGKKNRIIASSNNVADKYKQTNNQIDSKKMRKDQIDKQLKAVKNRLRDISGRKIYEKKDVLESDSNKEIQKKRPMSIKQKEQHQSYMKKQNEKQKNKIEMTKKQAQQLMKNLSDKDKRIQQLTKLLKRQQVSEYEITLTGNSIDQDQNKLKQQKYRKMKAIQDLKKKMNSQNKLIKQQMKQQQEKFMKLKQKQFQLKQQQITKKYESDVQHMKQQYIKRNKQLQVKIIEEQRIRKENQIRFIQEQRQMEQLRMQIQQKILKQQLLEEILKEQRQKQFEQQKKLKQSEQIRRQRLKREIIERQQLQRKIILNFQQQNRKLLQMFEEMKRKNEQIEKQNQEKLKELKKLEQVAKQEQQNLIKLEAELLKAKINIQNQQAKEVAVEMQQQKYSKNQQLQDIEQLKLKVKQQLLKQIMAKREQQQNQMKIQKAEKAKRLAEIQEQIRKQLRRQEEEIQRIQKQERVKYQRIKKQLQEEHQRKMLQLRQQSKGTKEDEQKFSTNQQLIKDNKNMQQKAVQNTQKNQIQKDLLKSQKTIHIQKQKDFLDKQKSNPKIESQTNQKINVNLLNQNMHSEKKNKQQKQYVNIINEKQDKLNQKIKSQKQLNIINEKEKSKQKKEDLQKQQIIDTNKIQYNQNINNKQRAQQQDKKQEQIPLDGKNQPEENKIKDKDTIQTPKQQTKQIQQNQVIQSQNKVERIDKKQPQVVKQSSEQILTKYQNLQQHLLKSKQIYIDDRAVSQFLNSFYSQLSPEVKEMMPYNQAEIQKFMISPNKKIDIFQFSGGHSIGWIQQQRYILIGQVFCVENIVRKYGQVQIQMTYIFNKTNPYQKQFLAKQVKLFDKVGFIYQKKLKQQNLYSIKLIIKVPMQILPKSFKSPTNQLVIRVGVIVQSIQKSQQLKENKKYSYGYVLSQLLKHCLNNQEQLELRQDKAEDSKIICEKMHYKNYNDSIFITNQIDDKKMKIQVKLDFKYIQTHDFPCFIIKGSQYQCQNNANGEKIFVGSIKQNLSVVVFAYDKLNQDFSLDILLNIKTKKINKERDVLICLPIWKKSENIKLNKPGLKEFNFNYVVEANLSYGSIISTNTLKEQFKYIEAPFIFSIFETNDNGLLLRPLIGEIVESKDVIVQKR